MKYKAMWVAAAAIFWAGAFSSQATAANKPINGRYTCRGTASQSILIGNVGGGTQSSALKGRLNASRGTFLIETNTPKWPAMIDGYLNPNLQVVVLSPANKTYKSMTVRDCSISNMQQKGSGSQNKNGRKVNFSIEQSYSCGTSNAQRIDRYDLTCQR